MPGGSWVAMIIVFWAPFFSGVDQREGKNLSRTPSANEWDKDIQIKGRGILQWVPANWKPLFSARNIVFLLECRELLCCVLVKWLVPSCRSCNTCSFILKSLFVRETLTSLWMNSVGVFSCRIQWYFPSDNLFWLPSCRWDPIPDAAVSYLLLLPLLPDAAAAIRVTLHPAARHVPDPYPTKVLFKWLWTFWANWPGRGTFSFPSFMGTAACVCKQSLRGVVGATGGLSAG